MHWTNVKWKKNIYITVRSYNFYCAAVSWWKVYCVQQSENNNNARVKNENLAVKLAAFNELATHGNCRNMNEFAVIMTQVGVEHPHMLYRYLPLRFLPVGQLAPQRFCAFFAHFYFHGFCFWQNFVFAMTSYHTRHQLLQVQFMWLQKVCSWRNVCGIIGDSLTAFSYFLLLREFAGVFSVTFSTDQQYDYWRIFAASKSVGYLYRRYRSWI